MCTVEAAPLSAADRQRLVVDNIGLAYAMAYKHRRMAVARGHDLEDAVQEASIALTIAASHFECSKGKYSSYACTSACRRLMRLRNFRRLPTRSGADEDLTGLETLADTRERAPDARLAEAELLQALETALRALPEQWRRIVEMYFGLGGGPEMTMQAIADQLGLSRQRVQQLVQRALRRLREAAPENVHAGPVAKPRRRRERA